jgi:hypothetical protein
LPTPHGSPAGAPAAQVADVSQADLVIFLTDFQPAVDAAVAEYAGDRAFDIGGPDVLSYREMMQRYARVAGFEQASRISSNCLYSIASCHRLTYPTKQFRRLMLAIATVVCCGRKVTILLGMIELPRSVTRRFDASGDS